MKDNTIIKTRTATYTTTRFSRKAGKIYFDGMAIMLANVTSIVFNGVEVR
jgi:hypothetical protein